MTLPGPRLSALAGGLRSSAVRELLEVASQPHVLSLAGGIPPPDLFPRERIAELTADLPRTALQYGETAGDRELRACIAETCCAGEQRQADDVLVTAGSQQALDLLARILCDPGDVVAVDDPGYLGAIQAFRAVGARLVPVPTDEDGLDVDALTRLVDSGVDVRAVFTVADGNNPTGAVMSTARRQALVALAQRHGFVVIEDGAYREVTPDRPPSLASLDPDVVAVGTVSKVIAPGLRVGWLTGPRRLIAAAERLKQSSDLHTSTLNQHLVRQLLRDTAWWAGQRERAARTYADRRGALLAALERHAGDLIEVRSPRGGLFVWARLLAPGADAAALLPTAIRHGVAFVPGAAFAADAEGDRHRGCLRLAICPVPPDDLDEAVRRLASTLASADASPA